MLVFSIAPLTTLVLWHTRWKVCACRRRCVPSRCEFACVMGELNLCFTDRHSSCRSSCNTRPVSGCIGDQGGHAPQHGCYTAPGAYCLDFGDFGSVLPSILMRREDKTTASNCFNTSKSSAFTPIKPLRKVVVEAKVDNFKLGLLTSLHSMPDHGSSCRAEPTRATRKIPGTPYANMRQNPYPWPGSTGTTCQGVCQHETKPWPLARQHRHHLPGKPTTMTAQLEDPQRFGSSRNRLN